ncbi:hypothetical protein EVB87_110 [Rhizobium phage RHph_N28_1]|nr:hypothetical protein EVB87_110 [Rhizobium phage RHph_N28_1]QIG74138.1 hypothetical protein EVC07_110 [Rhizobium phage RHph_N42]QXV73797.1 hypothetical protein [Rhizobium phage RHph_N46]
MKIRNDDIAEGLRPFTRDEFFHPNIEKQTMIVCSISEIVGTFAKWAIQQSPYAVPDNLEVVCKALDERLVKALRPVTDDVRIVEIKPMGFQTTHAKDTLVRLLTNILRDIPEYQAWNESKNNNAKTDLVFASRYGHMTADGTPAAYNPDNDFIDLHALVRNVAMTLVQRYILDSRDGYVMTADGPVKLEVKQPVTKAELSFAESLQGSTIGAVAMEDKSHALFIAFPTSAQANEAHRKLLDIMIGGEPDEETAH